jgi:hypothetical protein
MAGANREFIANQVFVGLPWVGLMRTALSYGVAAVLLVGSLLPQAVQPEPFGFKKDKLGMSLEDFKAMHLEPGAWENEATKTVASFDFHRPPTGKGWTWKPNLDCGELVGGVITRCRYNSTIGGDLHTVAFFVDGKLAIIGVSDNNLSPLVPQALVDGLGPPRHLLVPGNAGWSALRWDNGVSVVEFQEHYCHSGTSNDLPREFNDAAEVLRGAYCEGSDGGDASMGAVIWYVHRSLFSLTIRRWDDAIKDIKKKAESEPFAFDDKLGMSLEDFKHRRDQENVDCKETAKTITECRYLTAILGVNFLARAIFADDKLAAVHLNSNYQSQSRVVSGVEVPVDIKRALIAKFGSPEIIRGYEDPAVTVEDRRALHWDHGSSVIEYQGSDCHDASEGDEYKRITKILQRRYCERGDSGSGTFSVWEIDKALFAVAIIRRREADEDARKKARSDMFPSKNGGQTGSTPESGAPSKTVEKGQTFDQVLSILGKPDKILNLGTKMIYVYKDLVKVTFLDGKVSDVQ